MCVFLYVQVEAIAHYINATKVYDDASKTTFLYHVDCNRDGPSFTFLIGGKMFLFEVSSCFIMGRYYYLLIFISFFVYCNNVKTSVCASA